MKCNACETPIPDRRVGREIHYGALSIECAYYPSVELLCSTCVELVTTTLEHHAQSIPKLIEEHQRIGKQQEWQRWNRLAIERADAYTRESAKQSVEGKFVNADLLNAQAKALVSFVEEVNREESNALGLSN